MTMATCPITTPAGVLKGVSRPLPTSSPVTRRFRGVLHSLDDLIAAESDLDGYSGQDPALDAWIRDAERARRVTLDALNQLDALPSDDEGDAQLLHVARLFRIVMVSDDPAQVAYLRTLTADANRFLLTWREPLNFKLNQLILAGLDRLERFAALDDADPDNPDHQLDAADAMAAPAF
jgi:hypothetical protein